eukprot:5380441-Amphidinium_carterae.1
MDAGSRFLSCFESTRRWRSLSATAAAKHDASQELEHYVTLGSHSREMPTIVSAASSKSKVESDSAHTQDPQRTA